MNFHPTLSFSEEDKIRTTQSHYDALSITLRIGDYDVKKVMVDGGSTAEVMYPNLYKGLNLKLEDLMLYCFPLMSFNGKLVIPKGIIRLPIQTGPEIGEVNFIMVETCSPYFWGSHLLFASEGEIPIKGPGSRNPWLPIHGKAVCNGRHFTSAHCGVLGLY